jgi:hypothetical protein
VAVCHVGLPTGVNHHTRQPPLEGHIVLTIGANKNDEDLGIALDDAIELDILFERETRSEAAL